MNERRSSVPYVELLIRVHDALSRNADLAHDLDSLNGVETIGTLTREHNAISTIKNSVGHIRALSTSRSRS